MIVICSVWACSQVQILHNTCYPGEADDCEGWLECCTRITFLHDAAECQWILLWIQQFERRQLAGMATVVAYHTSLYGFNFAVHPQFRRLGFGRRIMHEAQLYALTLGLHQVSATVDASEPRLLKYYVNLGARVVSSGKPTGPAILRLCAPPPFLFFFFLFLFFLFFLFLFLR
eukprot:jgi/Botrbrau1/19318/Bobra.0073s0050.2